MSAVILVAHHNLELHRIVRHRARDRRAVFADKLNLAERTVALAELHVVGTVHEGAAAVLLAFGALGIRPGEHGDVDLVCTDGHLDGDIQHVQARGNIVHGRSLELFGAKRHAVHPDGIDMAAFRNERVTPEVHGTRRRVKLDVRTIRDVERLVERHGNFVMSPLRRHFLVRRAETGYELVLAVNHDVGVDRSVVAITEVLVENRHTFVIGAVHSTFVRCPAPVAAGGGHALFRRRT